VFLSLICDESVILILPVVVMEEVKVLFPL